MSPAVRKVTDPVSAAELDLVLDAEGRPYDAPVRPAVTAHQRPFASLHVTDGKLRVMDGNRLEIFPDEAEAAVDFRETERLDVDIVWERHGRREDVLGVRVQVPGGRPVARWGRFRAAYGTDGGVGGITSAAVVRRARTLGYDRWEAGEAPAVDHARDVQLLDLDGRPGPDSMIFSNGFGDGGFPMSVGRDANGRLVAVLIWDTRFPWLLAVPDGAPPPDVLERRAELEDCLAGRRPIQVVGQVMRCT